MPRDAAQVASPAGRVQGWQPITFQERGAAVPFTTPHLAGARLRAAGRGRLELVLPQVAGPGSVGILPWEHVGTLCSPSLFDRRVGARLAAAPALTPAAVRQAVCAEAAAGLAGPQAQEAAARAQAQDAAELERARGALPAAEAGSGAVAAVAALAALFGPVGLGAEAEAARLPRLLAALAAFADQLADTQRTGGALEADTIAATVRRTGAAAQQALATARALAADPRLLLRRWAQAPDAVAEDVARPEWLLDGWAWLCALWACPDERLGQAAVTLPEIAGLLPPLPRAAMAAAGPASWGEPSETPGGPTRSGITPQDFVARNECLLAAILNPTGAAP